MTSFSPPVYPSLFLKADRRTVIATDGQQTYRTQVTEWAYLDDVFIAPGAAVRPVPAASAGQLLLLPIVGGALLTTAHETEKPLVPGFIYTVAAAEADALVLANPFAETVNVLLIYAAVPLAAGPGVQELALPLTAKNVLVAPAGHPLPVEEGLFDSRVKGQLAMPDPRGRALCYVLNGSFEIEDRLAEHRDALLLWDTPAIDFEALAETSILFYLQLG